MKKLITTIAALSAMAVLSVSAFAAAAGSDTIDDAIGENGSHDVAVKYDDSTNKTVYSVDIVWGAMQFNYSAGTWDPDTHTYAADGNAGFTPAAEDDDKVTVTNHTNKELEATVAYAQDASHTDITGAVTPDDPTTIATAVGTAVDAAPNQVFQLALSGAPAAQLPTYTKVGTLTVTLA